MESQYRESNNAFTVINIKIKKLAIPFWYTVTESLRKMIYQLYLCIVIFMTIVFAIWAIPGLPGAQKTFTSESFSKVATIACSLAPWPITRISTFLSLFVNWVPEQLKALRMHAARLSLG